MVYLGLGIVVPSLFGLADNREKLPNIILETPLSIRKKNYPWPGRQARELAKSFWKNTVLDPKKNDHSLAYLRHGIARLLPSHATSECSTSF